MIDDTRMSPGELAKRLSQLSEGDRDLDGEIGLIMGYTRRIRTTVKIRQAEDENFVWDSPDGVESILPRFTEEMEHAYRFASMVCDGSAIASSWYDKGGAARISDGPFVTAVNPAIALCIAAINHLYRDSLFDDVEDDEIDGQE